MKIDSEHPVCPKCGGCRLQEEAKEDLADRLAFEIDQEILKEYKVLPSPVQDLAEKILADGYVAVEEALKRIFAKLCMDPVNNPEDRNKVHCVRKFGIPSWTKYYVNGVMVLEYEIKNDFSFVIREAQ